MKGFIAIVTTAFFCIVVSAQAQTPIKPVQTYHQDGITIVSPNQPGWTKLKTDKSETAFEKRTETDVLAAGLKMIQIKTFETEKDRLAGWEALKNEEFSKFKQDHLDFTYIKFEGVTCTHYDAFFPLEKTSSNKFAYFNVRGFVCPVSNSNNSALQIEFSDYSINRGFTEDINTLAPNRG